MNIAKNSIRKNYYMIPKSFVRTLTVCSSVGVLYHFGKKWNFFEKFYKKVAEVEKKISCEEMKISCLNFVGEMLFDNLAKINFSDYFNDIVNKTENSFNVEKEIEIKNGLVQDLLVRVLNDKSQMEKIKTKFLRIISESESFKDINSLVFYCEENREEITNFLKDLFTSVEVVQKFHELLQKNPKNYLNPKEMNRNVFTFTEKIIQDDDLKPIIYFKLEKRISTLRSEKEDKMKKVNKELIELINKL